MEPVRRASAGIALLPEEGSTPPLPTAAYTIQRGDTLSKLAARLQGQGLAGSREDILRRVLALNPQVTHPDRISVGAVLQLPAVGGAFGVQAQALERGNHVEPYAGSPPVIPPVGAPEAASGVSAGTLALLRGGGLSEITQPVQFQTPNGRRFSVSADGTPFYKQNAGEEDGGWGRVLLNQRSGRAATVGRAGCVLTCVAMALSKLSGQTVTPDVLDRHLDANGGYAKGSNSLHWAVAGSVWGMDFRVERHAEWDVKRVDAELEAGRPVIIAVGYKRGSAGGPHGTDHWLCLTRRDSALPDVYYANDPATGTEVKLLRQPGGLVEVLHEGAEPKRAPYRTTGPWTSFSQPGVA